MSEFKFPCPVCGRTISCDAAQANAEIACPSCQARIMAPPDASTATPIAPTGILPPPDIPPAFTGYTGTPVPTTKTSGLAIASLVCSLSSLITCVGWLPGIICGHLAKSRIRRNSSLKGAGLASAGLLIGYLILASEVGTVAFHLWHISAAVKHGFAQVQQNLATNQFVITQTQSTAASNNTGPVEPAAPAPTNANTPAETVPVGWSADLRAVSIPDHPVSGKLHGADYMLKSAMFRNGDLKLTAPNGLVLDIYRLGASVEGQDYEVEMADDTSDHPRVKMSWNEGDAQMTATFNKGYAMKLQFGQASHRKVTGKIYLCFPDQAKSFVAGTFQARLPQSRNGSGD